MKKLFLICALMCASVVVEATTNYHVITTCGYQFNVSGPDGFPGGMNGWLNYLREMNKHYCGNWNTPDYFEINPGD